MEPESNMIKFKCNSCGRKSMVIYRWMDNTPLGVCHECKAARELTLEELDMIIHKRICDRPGCGAEIPEGTGLMLDIGLQAFDPAEGTTPEGIVWDLCDECLGFFRGLMYDEEVTRGIFTSYRRSEAMRKVHRDKAQRPVTSEDPNPPQEFVGDEPGE